MRTKNKRKNATSENLQTSPKNSKSHLFRAKPNYPHWAKMALWHWHQAVILVLDKDPSLWLQYDAGSHRYDLIHDAGAIPSDLKVEYEKLYAAAKTYRDAAWSLEYMPPPNYMEWAQAIDLPVPEGLVEALKRLRHVYIECETQSEPPRYEAI
jgi:hypothetical protein